MFLMRREWIEAEAACPSMIGAACADISPALAGSLVLHSSDYCTTGSFRAMWFQRAKPLIGIDIGSHAIKLVRFTLTGQSYQLLDLALLPIPPDTVVDGVITDLAAVQGLLRRLLSLEKITDKDVALGLSGHSV